MMLNPVTAIVNQVATNPVSWFVILILGMKASLLLPKRGGRKATKKVFVNVSPSYLIGLYENKTTMQGDDLAAAYIGKWMPVTGTVQDIILVESDALVAQMFDRDGKFISASFPAEESEKLSHIARGETITVHGEIASVNALYLGPMKCDLDRTTPS